MKKKILILFVILAALLIASIPASAESVEAPYVLVFKINQLPSDIDAFIADAGGKLTYWMPEVGIAIATSSSPDFASEVGAKSAIQEVGYPGVWALPEAEEYIAEFDAPTSADSLFGYQWDIRRVGADLAWAEGVSGSHDTVVAIIDTGIDASMPDLAPNVIYEACYQNAGPCAPGTFVHWHGTHVAGTVAAAFDGGRVVGVGPNLGLAAYQVFEDGGAGAWDGPIWMAIIDAANQGFDVINMSLGGYDAHFYGAASAAGWTAWNRVVNYANKMGVTVVASSGNDGVNLNGTWFHIPGDLPGVINVGATGIREDWQYPQEGSYDVLTEYSNFGAQVTLSAPGGDYGPESATYPYPAVYYLILSTYSNPANGAKGYAWAAGTSMATPHVSGAAGLIKDANPDLNPYQVRAILTRTADKIGPRQLFGHGMLNVFDAVMEAIP